MSFIEELKENGLSKTNVYLDKIIKTFIECGFDMKHEDNQPNIISEKEAKNISWTNGKTLVWLPIYEDFGGDHYISLSCNINIDLEIRFNLELGLSGFERSRNISVNDLDEYLSYLKNMIIVYRRLIKEYSKLEYVGVSETHSHQDEISNI